MTIATSTTVHFFCTPKQLRSIADHMEQMMRFKHIGDDATAHTVNTGTHELRIVANQTEYDKHVKKLENQNWI